MCWKNKNILSKHHLICSSHIIINLLLVEFFYIKKLMHILLDASGYISISRISCRRFSHLNERTLQRFCLSQSSASTTGRLFARAAANKQPSGPENSLARTHMPNLARVELHGPWPKGLSPCPPANLLQHAIKRCTYHSN